MKHKDIEAMRGSKVDQLRTQIKELEDQLGTQTKNVRADKNIRYKIAVLSTIVREKEISS